MRWAVWQRLYAAEQRHGSEDPPLQGLLDWGTSLGFAGDGYICARLHSADACSGKDRDDAPLAVEGDSAVRERPGARPFRFRLASASSASAKRSLRGRQTAWDR